MSQLYVGAKLGFFLFASLITLSCSNTVSPTATPPRIRTTLEISGAPNTSQRVIGHVDRLNVMPDGSTLLSGWACEETAAQSIIVHVYAGGPGGGGTILKGAGANEASEQAVSRRCLTNEIPHRFTIPFTPSELAPHRGKALYVHGISPSGGENRLIGNSGNVLIPSAPPAYPNQVNGNIDLVHFSNGAFVVSGWACDTRIGASIAVHLYAGGPGGTGIVVKGAFANEPSEEGVSATCLTNGIPHRFNLRLDPADLAIHRGRKIYVHGVSDWGGENRLLGNSGNFAIPSGVIGHVGDLTMAANGSAVLSGWACDHRVPQSVAVHVYAGGAAPEGVILKGALAANDAEVAVSNSCGTNGVPHRFRIPFGAGELAPHRGKPLFVHGIAIAGAGNFAIGNSGQISIPTAPPDYRNEVSGNVVGIVFENNTYFLTGWACDRGIADSVSIHVYVGGPGGAGEVLRGIAADRPAEPAVSETCATTGIPHRFRMRFEPEDLAAHRGKKIFVHGISAWGGDNRLLAKSGEFAVPDPIENYYLNRVTGHVDGLIPYRDRHILYGWACDTAVQSSVGVHVYVGGPAGVGTLLTDTSASEPSEAAVSQACQTSGVPHRFHIELSEAQLAPHAGKKLFVYGISAMGGDNRPLSNLTGLSVPIDFSRSGNLLRLGLPYRRGETFPVLSGATPDGTLAFATDPSGSILFVPLIQPGADATLPENSLTNWYAWEGKHTAEYAGAPPLHSDQTPSQLGFAHQGALGFDPRYGTAPVRVQSVSDCVDHTSPPFYASLPQTGNLLCYKLVVFNPGLTGETLELFHSTLSVAVEFFGHTRPRVVGSRFHQDYKLVLTPGEGTHYGLEVSVTADSRLLFYNKTFAPNVTFAMAAFSEEPWRPDLFRPAVKLRELPSFYGDQMICLTPADPACRRVKLGDVYPIAKRVLKEPIFGESLFAHKDDFRCAYAWVTPDGRNLFCSDQTIDHYVLGADTDYNFVPVDGPSNAFHQRDYSPFTPFVFRGEQVHAGNTFGMFATVYEKRTQMPVFLGRDSGMWRAFSQTATPLNFRVNRRPHSIQMLARQGKFESLNPAQQRAVHRGNAQLDDTATFVFADINLNSFQDPHFVGYYNFMEAGYRGGKFIKADGSPDADYVARIRGKQIDVSGNYNYLVLGPGALEEAELTASQPDTFPFYCSNLGFIGHGLHFTGTDGVARIANGAVKPLSGTYSQLSLEFAFKVQSGVSRESEIRLLELNGGVIVEISHGSLVVKVGDEILRPEREIDFGYWNHFGLTFRVTGGRTEYEVYLNGEKSLDGKRQAAANLLVEARGGFAASLGPNGQCVGCGLGHVLSLDELAISDNRRSAEYFATAALRNRNALENVPAGFPFPIPDGLQNTRVHVPSEIRAEVETPTHLTELARLGNRLFHDPKLSTNAQGTARGISCASCHQSARAFTDGRVTAQGREVLTLNTPTLVNRLFSERQFFDKRRSNLFTQSADPVTDPREMGGHWPSILEKLSQDSDYANGFRAIYGNDTTINQMLVQKALTAFILSITSGAAPIDRGEAPDTQFNQGKALFFGKARCGACHHGGNFTDETLHDTGNGRSVKTPTLREIGKTAPYFHNGSAATLRDVVRFYNEPRSDTPGLDPEIQPLGLTEDEVSALTHFLGIAFEGTVRFRQ